MPYVYILQCADGSYYTGSTINLDLRLQQRQTGYFKGYTDMIWLERHLHPDGFVCPCGKDHAA